VDDVWATAQPLTIKVSGGANNFSTDFVVKALYDDKNIYFLAQWKDSTQSLRRVPYQKQADGTWKKLSDPNDKGGDNNLYYEDKFSFIWNINNSIKGFNEAGCFVACHPGEGKPYGNMYTANPGEIGDIWHWKSVRTGPVGQIDDQYLDDTRYDKEKAPEAGRKSDPKTAGGYTDNPLDEKKFPKFALKDNKPAPPYWILDVEKVAFDDTKYKVNDEVPSIVIAPMSGDRGDISAAQSWKEGVWTVEWTRKLDTGSKFDVQFTDLSKGYFFAVAVFDNAQVRHAFQTGASELRFAPAAVAGAPLPKTGEPPLASVALLIAGAMVLLVGGSLLSARNRH